MPTVHAYTLKTGTLFIPPNSGEAFLSNWTGQMREIRMNQNCGSTVFYEIGARKLGCERVPTARAHTPIFGIFPVVSGGAKIIKYA